MDFIKQVFNAKHEFWRYLIGSLLIFIAALVGQLPFTVAVFVKAMRNGDSVLGLDETKLMTLLEPNLNLFLMLLSFAFGLLGLFLVVKHLHKQSIREVTTARKKIDWKRILFAFVFWGIVTSGLLILDYYLNPESYVWNFELKRFLILLVIAVLLIPIQTSTEEYVFRGYLMQGFASGTFHNKFFAGLIISIITLPLYGYFSSIYITGLLSFIASVICFVALVFIIDLILRKLNVYESETYINLGKKLRYRWLPLLMTSVIFGGMHVFNPEVSKLGYLVMVYYIGTGLFLGIITLMDEGMELALGFHAANNLFGALLVTADWTVLQTHSVFKDISDPGAGFMDIVLPVFIVFPILIFIFAKVYKWKNWKQKLFGKVEAPIADDYKVLD